jgi:ABC-type multidrug transport system ATPase subunit
MDKMNMKNSSIVTESEKLTTGLLSEVSISLTPSLSSRIGSIKSSNYEMNGNIDLIWHNLRYVVDKNEFKNNKSKAIELIGNASGKGVSGKVTAFLGPSGAGKTTLIECLAGRRTIGLSGDIYVTGGQRTRIAFCAQRDFHLEELTVSETLLFATRLKNYNKIKILQKELKSHKEIITNILKQLGLESCSNVRVSACSGSQRKRLSIGIELVARPNILLLDEPTSGLDSSSCLQCIKLLQQLSRGSQTQPMAIIASLHQPSAQVLNLIDYLYIMSFGGRPIYYGPPFELMDYLNKFNLSCPMFVMPTDFTIEVASGDFGQQLIERMAFNQTENFDYYHSIPTDSTSVSKIVQKAKQESYPFFLHTWLLLVRNNITIWRQPQLTSMRFFTSIAIALLISFIYKNRIGQSNGCIEASLANFDLMRPSGHTNTNIGYIFFSLLFISLSSKISTILTFPLEMSVFLKERANGLYSCSTYYIAKSIADFPYQVS